MRIDKCVSVNLGEEYSRTYIKDLIDQGQMTVNGKNEKPKYIVKEGDVVELTIIPPEPLRAAPEYIPLNIIFEDDWIIVLNKPAGLVVHPGSGNKNGTLVNALLYYADRLADTGDELRPGIVHRLDKDTSGVIVIAKNERALRSLAKQFQKRAITKKYIAVVKGVISHDSGVVDAPIARHKIDRHKMDVVDDEDEGRNARTVYRVVKRFSDCTLVEVHPETGRTHQIRVHMKHIGHPVLGDAVYGGKSPDIPRQALHAETLGFTHPDSGKYVEFHAPVPDDIMKVIKQRDKR